MVDDSKYTIRSLARRLRSFFSGSSSDAGSARSTPDNPKLKTVEFSNFPDFTAWHASMQESFSLQQQYQMKLITGADTFTAPGYCFPCGKYVNFMIDYRFCGDETVAGLKIPNWRERLTCPRCGLNNRVRASVQFLEEIMGCRPESAIYISEQTTSLYQYLKSKYTNLVGSEYLGDRVNFGEIEQASGLRNESSTRLSFADESFDFVLSFDVFEHIPEYSKGLQECFRVLKPGGKLLFTVPFRMDNQQNLIRATRDSEGKVTHLMEPEYHGDPINDAGCLCFYHFGWQLLDELRDCGFTSAATHVYWSDKLGYLGQNQALFYAVKA